MADISKIKLPNNSEYLLKDIKALSRGEQLVTNGSGMIGDNTNFSYWTFDGSKANSSAGSFTRTGGYANIGTDDFFPVNANEKYKFEFDMVSQNNAGTMYAMLLFYDVDKIAITASDTMFYSGTLTTLARELKAGDTKVYLTDASNYKTYGTGSHLRMFTFWDYKNSFGYLYPPETYSRNHIFSAWESDDSIDKTNNVITLATAYTGITRPAGTYVSQGCSGGTYKYSAIIGAKVPTEWTHYTGYFDGTDYSGLNKGATFPPGAAYCKVGFLWNYNSASDQFWVTNISVKEVPKELADEVVLYGGDDTGLGNSTPADNAKAYYLNDDKVQGLKPKVFYNHSGTEFTTFFAKGSGNGNYGTILKWGHGDNYLRMLRRNAGSWSTADWEKISAGNADTAATSEALTLGTQVTGDTVNEFKGTTVKVAQIKSISIPGLGLAGSDGMIMWIPWSNTYGRQLIFDDTTHKILSRYLNNGNWSDWEAVAMLDKADANALINALDTGSSTPVDADYYISQYVGGGTSTTTYHRRPMSALWEYIKGKISSVLGLTATNYGGKAATAGTADSATNASKVNNHTVNSDVPANAVFTDTTYESKAASSGGTAVSLVTTGEKYIWNNKANNTVVTAGTSTTDGGLMSQADKTKLNGIATGADKTTVTQTITSGTQIGTVNGTPLYSPPKVGSFKGVKMLLMGNSYMRGVGGTVGHGWGYYFTQLTGCDSTIIQQSGGDFVATGNANADYPSKNYSQVIDTFAPTLTEAERASYQYIVVGGGYNDHQANTDSLAWNIEIFVTKCRTYFPNAVIWIIPLWCDRAMETAVEYSNFARWNTAAAINGCGSCGLTFSWFYGQSEYGAGDDIHLNDDGYQRCAKLIHAVLLGWDGNYIPTVGTGWTIGTNVTVDSTAGFRYYRDGKYVFIRGALAYTNSVATTKLGTISDKQYRARTAIYFPVFLYTSGSTTRYSAIACIQSDGILRLIPQVHALPASGTVYFDHMYLYGV